MMRQGITPLQFVIITLFINLLSNKQIVEVFGSSIRSSQSEHCFKASISLMHSEGNLLNFQLLFTNSSILETNDTTINLEIQSRPIYFMLDSAWLDSIKKLLSADSR